MVVEVERRVYEIAEKDIRDAAVAVSTDREVLLVGVVVEAEARWTLLKLAMARAVAEELKSML